MAILLDRSGTWATNGDSKKSSGETRPDLFQTRLVGRIAHKREIQATYDVARSSTEFDAYWANADRLDADSADSPTVRGIIVSRSRYEAGSNGYYDGLVCTHTDFVMGSVGPILRLQTDNPEFNNEVEEAWWSWAKAIGYRQKFWVCIHARIQDGEGFAVLRINPKIDHPVKLDIIPFETEQCTTPRLPPNSPNRIDGLWLDEFGNIEFYDILPYHPGAGRLLFDRREPEKVPAAYVVHLYSLRRPGQHRAVPEFRSTLNVGASSRRWREATVAAAETAADFAVLLHTNLAPDSGVPDPAAPFSAVQIEKRMQAALPMGWEPTQLEAKHPNAQYREFNRAQINEQARPKSIPQNIAMCDSSEYNFASGKLDQETYFLRVDVERSDTDDQGNEKVFRIWWTLAKLAYGWVWDETEGLPPHTWDWPKHPVGDIGAVASANDTELKNGSKAPSQVYTERGQDYNDAIEVMAKDYGVTPDEMRKHLLMTNIAGAKTAADMEMKKQQAEEAAKRLEQSSDLGGNGDGKNRLAINDKSKTNGASK